MTFARLVVLAACLCQLSPALGRLVLGHGGGAGLRGSRLSVEQHHVDEVSNPLLADDALPALAAVRAEHAVPAVTDRLKQGAEELKRIEAAVADPTVALSYDSVVLPLQRLYNSVGLPWELVNHLKSVRDAPEIRAAVETLQPQVIAFYQSVGQSKPIYEALQKIRDRADFGQLAEARQRVLKQELLDRKLGGVGLVGAEAEEFNKLQHELSDLSMTFSNNVLDARKAWNLTIQDASMVAGIPSRTLAAAAAAAKLAGHAEASEAHGPWLLTLDGTVLGPVLTYGQDRALREALFRASVTMASSGPGSNEGVIAKILKLRQRQAELLGFKNYADKNFATKMAKRDQVHALLDELQAAAKPAAKAENDELTAFAKRLDSLNDVEPWDRSFYAEKLRQETYGVDTEKLRVYFPYPEVVKGMFALCSRLFATDVEHVPRDSERAKAARWHTDVELYDVRRGGEVVGHLLVDPYSRPSEKQAGAWMNPMKNRRIEGGSVKLPVAVLVMNFPPPAADGSAPSLLSWGEAGTLFHEFGHALQHVLTVQNETAVSGISGVEFDAVEIASQFFEYWVELDKKTVYSFAKHYSTGEALPEATFKQLEDARTFRAGSDMLAQIYLGKVDLRLHEEFRDGEDPSAMQRAVAAEVLVTPPVPEARPLCTFSHIFSGGYSATYYSYQWSKVLSADAFSAFEEGPGGLANDSHVRLVGRRWADTLLAVGGGRDPGKVFEDFRGRAPQTEALLRYSGLPLAKTAQL